MDKKTARMVEVRARKASALLNEALFLAQNTMSKSEYAELKRNVGDIMGRIFLDVLNPIYKSHDELTPKQLRPK